MRRTPRVLLVAGAAFAAAAASLAPGASAAPAQLRGYVVVLEDGAGPPAAVAERLADRYGGDVGYVYRYALRGFYLRTTDRAAAALANNPNVDYVEAESPVTVDAQSTPTGAARAGAAANTSIAIDGGGSGVDVDVAVLDTGIATHEDLAIRSTISCVDVSSVSGCGGTGGDVHGHGTHVAGSIAALDNNVGVVGVAPGARLWSVKVLGDDGSGSNAGVAAGLDWVIQHNALSAEDIEVANLSLGGGYSSVMNQAVARAVDAGVSVVVAAGNDGRSAGNYSPASEPKAITVSALADFNGAAGGGARWTCYPDTDDTLADFSNYGSVVDIIAPGMCIHSTTPGGYGTKSGTSMASPHVAGAAALLRSMGRSRADTESLLKSAGNTGWSGDRDTVKEPLLDVSDRTVFAPRFVGSGGTTPPANTAPSAAFTASCSLLTCTFTDGSSDPDQDTLTWQWDFGGGSGSTDRDPVHTYPAGGTYPVTLTVSDGDATDWVTHSVTVTAATDPPPSSDPEFLGSSSRNGKSAWRATISVSGATAGATVSGTWDKDGVISSGGCTVGSTGTCSFSLSKISNGVPSVTWTWSDGGTPVTVQRPQ